MVKAWKETVIIPTYEIGAPEKNPIFLENRVYQGSSGRVYPYPVIEKISDEKVDKEWHAVWLENEYIKVMILPELGGRIQMAYDKINQRHFVYYNHVIKPALVGLAGPWISGGIEFNWPQHHRPSTYMPVDSTIEENEDGSVTVWVNEMERMFHQKGMAGFTLRPGCAYLEIKGRAINRMPIPQTFLWWANPAVSVNDDYQSVFPQDVNAVFDHGKRAVSSFPIATGTYYKMDYSVGVDISNYKNIKVPTSYMAVNSKYNFEGGYENDTKGGMLHVASHNFSPGKKQWTWGNGDFGRAWDRNLTDDDGPYIELMAGVYTENQPDFTWLQPYEEKLFTQYFMPYRELGIVKNASKDVVMNIMDGKLCILATSRMHVTITVETDTKVTVFKEHTQLSPESIYQKALDGIDENQITVTITRNDRFDTILLTWHAEDDEIRPIPDSAEAALRPEEIKTVEQLYLTGLHLEQYRHATFHPTDYYEEGLRRDPLDVRCNHAMGLWLIRNGQAVKAQSYLEKAVKVLQKRNPNPYDGEPIYHLALCLKLQGKIVRAYELFNKATWNAGLADAAFFQCAEISVLQHRYEDATEEIEKCLIHNSHHHRARAVKASLMCMTGDVDKALAWIEESLKIDRFNFGCLYERMRITEKDEDRQKFLLLMRQCSANYEELILDYCDAGMWDEAVDIAGIATAEGIDAPMIHYYKAWAKSQLGQDTSEALHAACTASDYCCFPNRLEAIIALRYAISANQQDAKAPYYLGCLYYDKRQYEDAMDSWNISKSLDPQYPTVWRNLALALFNKKNDVDSAVEYMEKAFALDETDARVFMELDQLYKRLHQSHAERLKRLEAHADLIAQRDDLLLEEITLLNQTGNYEKAIRLIAHHQFHAWEGGEGKISGQYQFARVELAKQLIPAGEYDRAIDLLNQCLTYPDNLGEGKLYGAQENDFYYLMGVAYEQKGNIEKAIECWQEGTVGPTEPAPALYYNDAKPDKIFYAGLCYAKLSEQGKANGLFYKLINFGKNHLFDEVRMDYFAVSLPDLQIWNDSLQTKNTIHCKYMLALGNFGLGNRGKGIQFLDEVSQMDNNHLGVLALQTFITHHLE